MKSMTLCITEAASEKCLVKIVALQAFFAVQLF